jgi:hypothetical protein
MKILVISFYYEPDLCPGSFRTSSFVNSLREGMGKTAAIEVITTMPNRYRSFKVEAKRFEKRENLTIRRIYMPPHKSGFFDQALSFLFYFTQAVKYTRNRTYDAVFATSSRLFTAFLGAFISYRHNIPLYLDIRDIFSDTMKELLINSRLRFLMPLFMKIEAFTMNRAKKINLVSRGFEPYFSGRYKKGLSFFPNGIDDEFLNFGSEKCQPHKTQGKRITLTYSGNIGSGQGLEKIVPPVARKYKEIEFLIIGDGGRRGVLEKVTKNLENVKLIDPLNRTELIDYYRRSDALFLQLNDYEAFKKVLPSKIFEYGATFKPIIAGVDGYAKEFIEKYLPDSMVFKPCDFGDFMRKFEKWPIAVDLGGRKEFTRIFSRRNIMDEMVKDFLRMARSEPQPER